MENKKAASIDEYIEHHDPPVKELLDQVRNTIKSVAPDATETIKYKMPTFVFHGNLVFFAAFKNHIGIYALPTGNIAFQKKLSAYKTGKGSIQFSFDQPLPLDLITEIVKFRVQENLAKLNESK